MKNQNIEELKRKIDIVQYIGRDIALKKNGKGHMGLCPFHDDHNPSLCVNADTQTFKCFGCGESGDILAYIMRRQGVDFKAAIHTLEQETGSIRIDESTPAKKTKQPDAHQDSVPKNNLKKEKTGKQIVLHYAKNLERNDQAQSYITKRCLFNPELIKEFSIGFSDGSLLSKITPESEEYLALKEAGFISKTGKEYFSGYIVVPFFNEDGSIGEVYGRAVHDDAKIKHKYLPGPHSGLLNPRALKVFDEIYLCECVIDALSLWILGYKNVTSAFGKMALGNDLIDALSKKPNCKVFLCYDNDGTDDRAAESTAQILGKRGVLVVRVHISQEIKDVNNLLMLRKEEGKSIDEIKAEFDAFPRTQYSFTVTAEKQNETPDSVSLALVKDMYGIMQFQCVDREYIVKKLRRDTLLNLKVTLKLLVGGRYFLEAVNLESTREREFFCRHAKDRIGTTVSEYDLLADLESLTYYLEAFQQDLFIKLQEDADSYMNTPHIMTPEEKETAITLITENDYLTEIFLPDMQARGLRGERNNILIYMIAGVSRLDPYPVHVLVVAPFGSGKSELQKSVVMLLPKKDVFRLSRTTEQVLFYVDEDGLFQKVVSIDEIDGTGENRYTLRTLMSERKLEILYTDKNELGQLKAKHKLVKGPTSVFLATTDIDKIDEETLSRMLILYGDESVEQTRNIMDSQFLHDNTEEGDRLKEMEPALIKKHQDIHSVIEPLRVYFPKELRKYILEMDEKLTARRNFRAYGTVVRSIARTRMFRRKRYKKPNGEEYIIVEKEDIELANELLAPVFADLQADLKGTLKIFYDKIVQYVDSVRGNQKRSEVEFTARQIREYTGLGHSQTHINLEKLVRMEYLVKLRGKNGLTFVYRLLDD